MTTALAGLLAMAAALLVLPGDSGGVLSDRLPPQSGRQPPAAVVEDDWPRWATQPLVVGVLLALVVRFAAGRPHLVVLGLTVVGLAWATNALLARQRARRLRLRRRAQVVSMCDALAAELQAGQPPVSALAAVSREWPELEIVGDAARLGGDIPSTLRTLARRPGNEPLSQVAAGWEVAYRTGAGLAGVLDRLACVLRDDEEVRREVAANLASPRATAVMLAMLPVFGIALGTAIGADPAGVLLGSLPGAVCLATGCLLALTGLFWVERITARAEV